MPQLVRVPVQAWFVRGCRVVPCALEWTDGTIYPLEFLSTEVIHELTEDKRLFHVSVRGQRRTLIFMPGFPDTTAGLSPGIWYLEVPDKVCAKQET